MSHVNGNSGIIVDCQEIYNILDIKPESAAMLNPDMAGVFKENERTTGVTDLYPGAADLRNACERIPFVGAFFCTGTVVNSACIVGVDASFDILLDPTAAFWMRWLRRIRYPPRFLIRKNSHRAGWG